MKAIIVCTSVSHGNTKRVADVMGQILQAPVVDPDEVDVAELATYDLVGFGSGIFSMQFHPRLRQFVQALPTAERGKAFVFATSGLPELPFRPFTRPLVRLLGQKGFEVNSSFSCRAHDTWLPFRIVGGINKGRPNTVDLESARAYAQGLRAQVRAAS
ncbi:flavodoxin family protein [Streptomyces sp. NPDC090442]|uniref:flavodoxin family protein n=1 Tax=Streptomyces sp. NPDC090442 TaxID=3365962 RepID=UPI0038144DD1